MRNIKLIKCSNFLGILWFVKCQNYIINGGLWQMLVQSRLSKKVTRCFYFSKMHIEVKTVLKSQCQLSFIYIGRVLFKSMYHFLLCHMQKIDLNFKTLLSFWSTFKFVFECWHDTMDGLDTICPFIAKIPIMGLNCSTHMELSYATPIRHVLFIFLSGLVQT